MRRILRPYGARVTTDANPGLRPSSNGPPGLFIHSSSDRTYRMMIDNKENPDTYWFARHSKSIIFLIGILAIVGIYEAFELPGRGFSDHELSPHHRSASTTASCRSSRWK